MLQAPASFLIDTTPAALEFSFAAGSLVVLAVVLHTAAMLGVMGVVAWAVYKKLGLAVLRKGWLDFDLLWAAALLVVGIFALGGRCAPRVTERHPQRMQLKSPIDQKQSPQGTVLV